MTKPQLHVFGWCSGLSTNPDAHHDLCRIEYVGTNGVKYVCACPQHGKDD
jgi:hypothetical protein